MQVSLFKSPYEISFTGNPMPYAFAISPYGDTERLQDIRLQVRILLEETFNSNVFTEIKNQNFYPDDDGKVEIDVRSMLDAYLDWYTPKPGLQSPVQAFGQRKRYKLSYILQKDGAIVGSVTETTAQYAVKGGLAFEQWHWKEFFTTVIATEKKPLLFTAAKEKVAEGDTRFLYWMYPFTDGKPQTVTYKVYLNDGSTVTKVNANTVACGKWAVCCVPSGFQQCGLDAIVPTDFTAQKYSIKIATADNTVVDEYFFTLDQRFSYDSYQLLYRNSIGGLETQRLSGEVSTAADYDRQQAQRTLPPSYFSNGNLMAAISDEGATESFNVTGDTGFLSKPALMKTRDLFLSPEIYEVIPISSSRVAFIPSVLSVKKAAFYSNKDNLVSVSISWQRAFVNEFYTPGMLMPISRSCPAMLGLVVTQMNKNFLQIIYALEEPYDKVQIQIVIGATTYTYTYTGNTGIVKQEFANPSTGDAVNITVNGRTICNNDTAPFDLGPVKTVTVPVTGATGLVANNDNYSIPQGYNTSVSLTGSTLANDYDPDGNAIEVIFATEQATTQGGVYSIDSAGLVTYKPPSSTYVGVDSFSYSIRNVGTEDAGASATVSIKVGSTPSGIFIKMTIHNFMHSSGQYQSSSYGEMWLEFYGDPSGSQPLDITAYNITVPVLEIHESGDASGNESSDETTINVLCTGTSVKFYDGLLSFSDVTGPGTDGGPEVYEDYNFIPQTDAAYNLI